MTKSALQNVINELYDRLDGIKNELGSLTLDTRAYLDDFCDKDKTQRPSEYEEFEYIWHKCRQIEFSFRS